MMGIASAVPAPSAALLDFVDRRERGPSTPAALEHLAACERCERELAEVALTIIALRRAGRELRARPVPTADAARIAASAAPATGRWPWRLQLGRLLASAAIVALVVAPTGALRGTLSEGAGAAGHAAPHIRLARGRVPARRHAGHSSLLRSRHVAGTLPRRPAQAVEGGVTDRRVAASARTVLSPAGPSGPPPPDVHLTLALR